MFYSLLFQLYHNQLHLLQVHLLHTELERINCLQSLLSRTIKCESGKPISSLTGTKLIVIVLCNDRNKYIWKALMMSEFTNKVKTQSHLKISTLKECVVPENILAPTMEEILNRTPFSPSDLPFVQGNINLSPL